MSDWAKAKVDDLLISNTLDEILEHYDKLTTQRLVLWMQFCEPEGSIYREALRRRRENPGTTTYVPAVERMLNV